MKKSVRMADIGALLSSPLAKNDLGPMILPQSWNGGEHSPPLSPTESSYHPILQMRDGGAERGKGSFQASTGVPHASSAPLTRCRIFSRSSVTDP